MNEITRRRLEALRAKGRDELAQNPLYRQPGWVAAHARLVALLPNVSQLILAPYNMLPDLIFESATEAGVVVESVALFNPWRGDPAGRGTKPWESYETLELFDVVFASHPPVPGPLWFILTTASAGLNRIECRASICASSWPFPYGTCGRTLCLFGSNRPGCQ